MIYTIGHSTHSLDEFLQLLRAYNVNQVIDIRTIPRSHHNPQFNQERLAKFLRNHKINYAHMKALGGFKHPHKNSINSGWQNASFRGFADYMQTITFKHALEKLITKSHKKTVAIMCSEAVYWRCHRRLIADALKMQRLPVQHITTAKKTQKHSITSWAKRKGSTLYYPKKISIE